MSLGPFNSARASIKVTREAYVAAMPSRGVDKDLRTLDEGISGLEGAVRGLKEDFKGMEEDLKGANEAFKGLDADVETLLESSKKQHRMHNDLKLDTFETIDHVEHDVKQNRLHHDKQFEALREVIGQQDAESNKLWQAIRNLQQEAKESQKREKKLAETVMAHDKKLADTVMAHEKKLEDTVMAHRIALDKQHRLLQK